MPGMLKVPPGMGRATMLKTYESRLTLAMASRVKMASILPSLLKYKKDLPRFILGPSVVMMMKPNDVDMLIAAVATALRSKLILL